MGATGLKCNFFFFKFATKSLEKKKRGGACRPPNGRQAPVPHPRGDRPLSPVGGGDRVLCQAWPTKPIEFHSSSVRRFIVIYLQKDLEIEFELS